MISSRSIMKVTSNPNVGQILVILLAGGLLFFLMGTFLIFIVAPDYPLTKQLGVSLVGGMFYIVAFLGSVNYFKSAPEITVTLDDIVVKYLFKRIVIKTDQVQTIHLSQKSDYQFLFIGMQMDSTIIELKNDKKLIFWDFMYEDFGRVKRALDLSIKPDKLERLNALRREKAKVTPINREDLSTENFVALKGNGIFNFYGILLVGMLGVFIMGIDRENYLRSILVISSLSLG
jgi:hypothetical protein